ncbi:MAG TPA: hypothetical protein VLA89_09270 [Gemmatimonadales bacterium]|nr:hypothetical protein [Gemmatimonadales bacterium]
MTDIQELFNRDPLSYSKQDVSDICEKLRTMRKNFDSDAKTPAKSPQRSAPKKVDLLDLGDIEI